MEHIVNITDKDGCVNGLADCLEICRPSAEKPAEFRSKRGLYTAVHVLGAGRTGIVSDIDPLHQVCVYLKEVKGLDGCFKRCRETPDSEWEAWEELDGGAA